MIHPFHIPQSSANNNGNQPTPQQAAAAAPSPHHHLQTHSEAPMPQNQTDITMSLVIDRTIIPEFLASNPTAGNYSARRCKLYYKAQMIFRHAGLVVRVERWRQGVPDNFHDNDDDDGDFFRERIRDRVAAAGIAAAASRGGSGMRWGQQALVDERRERDRRNLTDYVNGDVEGIGRGRLMCWPVLLVPMMVAGERWRVELEGECGGG